MICESCAIKFDPSDHPGGLLFSPPKDGRCRKIHLCADCYDVIDRLITNINKRSPCAEKSDQQNDSKGVGS